MSYQQGPPEGWKDPMKSIFQAPLNKMRHKNREHYCGRPAIIPGMTPEVEHACLAEIRSMAHHLSPWKRLPNGMTAGEFAFLYVNHFKEKRNVALSK